MTENLSNNRAAGMSFPVSNRSTSTDSRSAAHTLPNEITAPTRSASPRRQRRLQATESTRQKSLAKTEQPNSETATASQGRSQFQTLEILDRVRDEFQFLRQVHSAYNKVCEEKDDIARHYRTTFEKSQFLEAKLIHQVEINNRYNAFLNACIQQLSPAAQKVAQIEMDHLAILTNYSHVHTAHLTKGPQHLSTLNSVSIPTKISKTTVRSEETTGQCRQSCTSEPSPIASMLKSAPIESSHSTSVTSSSYISSTPSSSASISPSSQREVSSRTRLPSIRDALEATIGSIDSDETVCEMGIKREPMLRAASEPRITSCKSESYSVNEPPNAKKRKKEDSCDRDDRSSSALNSQNAHSLILHPPLRLSGLYPPQISTQNALPTQLHPPTNRRFSAPHIYAPHSKTSAFLDSYRISTTPPDASSKNATNIHDGYPRAGSSSFREPSRLKLVESIPHGDVICAIASGGYDASTIYTGGNGVVKVWQNPGGGPKECVSQLRSLDSYIRACKTSTGGELLAVAGESNRIVVWDLVASSPQIRNSLTSSAAATYAMCLSPDSRLLFSGGSDGDVNVFDLVSERQVRKMKGHYHGATCMEMTSDGGTLVTGSLDKTVRIWNVGAGATVSHHTMPSQIYSLGIGLSGTHANIAVGLENSDVNLIPLIQPLADPPTKSIENSSSLRSHACAHDGSVLALKFHPLRKDAFVSAGKDGKLVGWKTDPIAPLSANPMFQLYENHSILCCDISENYVLTGSDERCARVYEICA